ncbi:MAG: thioredoxin domain-containing protein [Ktedonobacteraceae bacterium]|nr:thioredoxin domain-containing protein [Ktedonobacteraceae bacterium]MBO0793996.1 thioredoxin domain-containing protein [Ktedonobacteraceae bacterium]
MSGRAVAEDLGSASSDPDGFRFSPRPNQAHKIQWRSWGEEAFQEAVRANKPVFLVISCSWSSWCHLMDETTLSEPTIIAIVNNDYIPIRVDSDLRPDVNRRYNQNGWPSIVLLSSEGEILWGGVYVPPKQMLYYLGYIRRYYGENRQEIAEQVRELRERRVCRSSARVTIGHGGFCLSPEQREALEKLPAGAYEVLSGLYDRENGGFSIHPHLKFPHPPALELLLYLDRCGYPEGREMVDHSLRQMRDGGLWDHDGGGFFRYSAASDWSAPHTEKMLKENAGLLRLLLLMSRESGEQEWYDMARQLVFYLNTTLWRADVGVFSGSQSADEEYYEPGPYSRASQQAPHVDKTVYTAWNARVISAYLLAAQILQQPSLRDMALRTLDFLCTRMMHPSGCVCHYAFTGQPMLPGLLTDQVWLARVLLDAYEVQGNVFYLENAIALMHFACEELLEESSGLFFDAPENPHAVGRLELREQPLTGNAIAAECLLRMAEYSKRRMLHDTGLLVLSSCLEKYRHSGIQGAVYAHVVTRANVQGWLRDWDT